MNRAAILVLSVALLVAGCTDEAADPAEQGGEAAGEVLGGEISDAMIPLEQIESQAPLAPRQGPTASDVDAKQPEITPAAGVEGTSQNERGEAALADSTPEPAE